ncbi:MAG: protein kinase [bacterium]|nr:protein kinase [bacterium]
MQTDAYIGKQIDDFTIQERIGVGGMATVYRAYQPSVNRYVALKLIRLDPNAAETSEFARRFAQEAKMIAALEHIHILPIFDYGLYNNEIAYLAMRLLRGGSLSNLLADGPLETERACDIFTQVARGLSYAHQHHIIHRDLKPSNILMDEAGNAYLTDFGLAKMTGDTSQNLTKTGTIVGTPVYMSPEQLRGEAVSPRSDIYSMGVIMYHMLVGKPPFDSSESNMISVIYKHLEEQPKHPRTLNPEISDEVEAVVLRALAKNPADRYQTIDDMALAFNAAIGRRISTGSYPTPVSRPSLPKPPKSRTSTAITPPTRRRLPTPVLFGGAALAALVVIAAAVVILTNTVRGGATVPVRPVATVVRDTTGVPDEVVPTEAEIAAAQARLGDNGFISYVACNQTSEYHATQAREMRDAAARMGITLRIYDSNNDPYLQITDIERARTDGTGGMILCPLDVELLEPSLESLQASGLPLVLNQGDMESYGGVLMGGDDYLLGLEAGRAAGAIIRDELGGRARVIVLDFPSMPVIVARANGAQDGVLEVAPGATIIGRYLGGTRDNGYESVKALLDAGTTFDVIVSINDAGAYGAIQALDEAGLDPSAVVVSSVDAERLAQQYIRDGYFMRASVAVSRELSSETTVNVMVKLLAGATLPELILVPPGDVVTEGTSAGE